jgi:hypothetical protein
VIIFVNFVIKFMNVKIPINTQTDFIIFAYAI